MEIGNALDILGDKARRVNLPGNPRIEKDDFLRLLFTQLKYQDFESSVDYKELLAQLSMLAQIEQSMNLSKQIENLSSSIAHANFLSASNLLGKNAFVVGDNISVANGGVKSYPAFSLDIPANEVYVNIKSLGGVTVKSVKLNNVRPGNHYVQWDGRSESGNLVPDGDYSFEVVAYDSAGNQFKPQKLVYGSIDSVSLDNSSVFIAFGNKKFEFEKVVEVRGN